MKILHVPYKAGLKCSERDGAILSFMSPDEEYELSKNFPGLMCGCKEMDAVREEARNRYIDIVARIASTPCFGKTLRQVVDLPGRGNPWWYHRVSEKQVESDGIFNMVLQIFTIAHVASREKATEIILYGAPEEVVKVLRSRYKVSGINCSLNRKYNLFRAIISRTRYLVNSIFSYYAIQRDLALPKTKPSVVFHGFWDWSVSLDEKTGEVNDKYFKNLPDKFRNKGITYGWFVWIDRRSKAADATKPTSNMHGVGFGERGLIFVQKLLKMSDILSAIFTVAPFFRYSRFARSKDFRSIFAAEGFDMWPLFRERLAYGFCDSSMPHHFLMETAYKKAFDHYKPSLSFTFLELFLASRAFNMGALLGNPKTVRCDMQHASYAKDKTFILTDRDRELRGKPDGISMPAPEYNFVMGELCRDILIADGFPEHKIFVTGSARFDHIDGNSKYPGNFQSNKPVRVLMVATLNVDLDFEMVRAAYLASDGLDIKLCLRSHPMVRIEDLPKYKKYSDRIVSSTATLDDDLNTAGLILFTYSTVAEEAFIKGRPILRWQVSGFNGSVFKDLGIAESAYSVESLKDAFKRFIDDPSSFTPDEKEKEIVLRNCFYRTDGRASDRIAEKSAELLKI